MPLRALGFSLLLAWSFALPLFAAEAKLSITSPMAPPHWALLERELLDANHAACEVFFQKYFDERGWLLCVERWGGDDGPDDAIENVNDWPLLHALGGDDRILEMYKHAWEGHLRQFTLAKTTHVEFARDGMYYKEFPVTMDWVHNGEGLSVFNLQGLSDPHDGAFGQRVRRFAGFYMNEDPGAPNYDPEHRIIRSLFNGSRGPLMRKATGLDWAGDPIEVKGRFKPRHGEDTYEQMLAHFEDYNDIIGDHPQNLLATSLALNAYMLTGEPKYRDWLLEYVDAWKERMAANGDIIPTNIGLDGKIGSAADGKWYGGVYGWGFTVKVPQDGSLANRNTHALGVVGFLNAFLLTGDDGYLDAWRKQIAAVNANQRTINGQVMYPTMYGDFSEEEGPGWYGYTPSPYRSGAQEIYYLGQRAEDRALVDGDPWVEYLDGDNPEFPSRALNADLEHIRTCVAGIHADDTTPDTRLSDDPMPLNPASVTSLIPLMLGGIHPQHRGAVLNCRVRYFDPLLRRAGVPEGVAALVESLTPDGMVVTLVNTNQIEPRTVTLQAGGYAEHQFVSVSDGENVTPIDDTRLTVTLAPGAGRRLAFRMHRFANQPTMLFPWDR